MSTRRTTAGGDENDDQEFAGQDFHDANPPVAAKRADLLGYHEQSLEPQ